MIEADSARSSQHKGSSSQPDLSLFNPSGSTLEQNSPAIERQPVIFTRQRRVGPGNVFDLVLEDIASREVFPSSLLQILGLEAATTSQAGSHASGLSVGNEMKTFY